MNDKSIGIDDIKEADSGLAALPKSGTMELLLEIGVEEVPAGFLPKTMVQMQDLAVKVLADSSVAFGAITVYATPRRLFLGISGVAARQSSRVKEFFGPPLKAAFTQDGTPTKAAIGFAQTHSLPVDSLQRRTKGKGEYLVAVIEEKGQPVKDIAAAIFSRIITSVHFPRMMRWGDSDFRFVRPIRWIMAVCAGEHVEFELGGILSCRHTFGHRFLSPQEISVDSIESYVTELRNNYVVVDPEERRNLIISQLKGIAGSLGLAAIEDEELINHVTFLVEYPQSVSGTFSKEFLALPRDLPVSVMRDHQKYFSLETQSGELSHHFVVVSNTLPQNAQVVRSGAERVIKARLDDARFYYEDDLKGVLADSAIKLKGIVFQEKLGTLYDKIGRMYPVAEALRRLLDPEIPRNKVERAVLLSKADLTTGVVREFPELQGIMGAHYASINQEDSEVAESIKEQYLPANARDREALKVPATGIGTVLSLTDKLDNLFSFFSIGLVPSGSEDPFALRRQAMGVVMILINRKIPVTLREIFTEVAATSGEWAGVVDNLYAFFRQRLESLFSLPSASLNYDYDVIQAAMPAFEDLPLYAIVNRLEALKQWKAFDGYNEFLLALKRVYNIVPKDADYVVVPDALAVDCEKSLYEVVSGIKNDLDEKVSGGDYLSALKILNALVEPINTFFDKVLVMDKDLNLRHARFGLLQSIVRLSGKVADLPKLQERQ